MQLRGKADADHRKFAELRAARDAAAARLERAEEIKARWQKRVNDRIRAMVKRYGSVHAKHIRK